MPLVSSPCFGRSKRARMFPTKSFRDCVRPALSVTRMSAENSIFCADVDMADIKNNYIISNPREIAFISAPCPLRNRAFHQLARRLDRDPYSLSFRSIGTVISDRQAARSLRCDREEACDLFCDNFRSHESDTGAIVGHTGTAV